MSITIDFSPADLQLLREQAAAGNVSLEEFIRQSSMKSARNAAFSAELSNREAAKEKRNAEYLAKIDRGIRQMNEGTGKFFTDEELEELFRGNKF